MTTPHAPSRALSSTAVRRRTLGLCALLALGAHARVRAQSSGPGPVEPVFDIPAGDLQRALEVFARQAQAQLLYRTEDLKGTVCAGLKGRLRVDEALRRLLGGTRLRFRRDVSGAFVLFPEGAGA